MNELGNDATGAVAGPQQRVAVGALLHREAAGRSHQTALRHMHRKGSPGWDIAAANERGDWLTTRIWIIVLLAHERMPAWSGSRQAELGKTGLRKELFLWTRIRAEVWACPHSSWTQCKPGNGFFKQILHISL